MMKDDNEDDLKNKEDLHRWKAHGAGHIPLCGIFQYVSSILYTRLGSLVIGLVLDILKSKSFLRKSFFFSYALLHI